MSIMLRNRYDDYIYLTKKSPERSVQGILNLNYERQKIIISLPGIQAQTG
jgi:hypothetical protein